MTQIILTLFQQTLPDEILLFRFQRVDTSDCPHNLLNLVRFPHFYWHIHLPKSKSQLEQLLLGLLMLFLAEFWRVRLGQLHLGIPYIPLSQLHVLFELFVLLVPCFHALDGLLVSLDWPVIRWPRCCGIDNFRLEGAFPHLLLLPLLLKSPLLLLPLLVLISFVQSIN